MTIRKTSLFFFILLLSGCAAITRISLDHQYGPADPARFDRPAAPAAGQSYLADVQPILARRCVVCHACYDAPCQLKFLWPPSPTCRKSARIVSRSDRDRPPTQLLRRWRRPHPQA